MPLGEMIIGAILEIAVDAGWDKARKHQVVQQVLRKVGRDFDPVSANFDDIYTYTLVAFGIGKPRSVIDVFRQQPIRDLCRRAYDAGDQRIAENELREVIDWPVLQEILALDVSPEPLMREFLDSFEDAVNRSRTTIQVRQDRKLNELVGGQEQLAQLISQGFEELKAQHLASLPSVDPGAEKLDREQAYHLQIDQARELIEGDKADAALILLQKLENELQDREISDHLRFRLLTNIGACYLPLGDDTSAVPYFEQALLCAPDDPKALANAGLAALIQDDLGSAMSLAEQALGIQADHPSALSVWVQATAKAGQLDQIDEQRRVDIEGSVESRRALAVSLTEAGDYESAEELLRRSIESGEHAPQDLALLAQAILESVRKNRQHNPPLPWRIPAEEEQALEEAESLLDQVINAWKLIENRKRFHTVLGLRIQTRALQGKLELAEKDCQRILLEDSSNPIALHSNGLIAIRRKDFASAVGYFQKCLDIPELRSEASILLAATYLWNEQPHEALNVLTYENEATEEALIVQLDRLSLLAKAASITGNNAQIAEVMEQLHAFPEDPLVLEIKANIDVVQGQIESAIQHLQKALYLTDGGQKDRITLRLAGLYYAQNQFDEAIPLYEAVVPIDKDTPATREYLVCLLNSGDWNRAYDLARRIRNGGSAIPVVSEVEGRIAEYIGDLDLALHLYSELTELEPNYPEHYLRVASVYVRQGRPVKAAAHLDPVLELFADNPSALIETAKIFAVTDRPAQEVLSLAYRARRLGHTPEIHLSYIALFTKVENDPSLDLKPTEVVVGSSVQLASDREALWYTILEEVPIDQKNREFAPSDPISKKLLGRKIGEMVQLKEGPYEQLEYRIAEIQSKYVRAFQETLLNFSSWFPDHQGLHQFEVVDNDLSPIFKVTGVSYRWQTQMHELYSSRQLTLEGFAQAIGRGVATVWAGSIVGENTVIACLGNPQEQSYHRRVAASSTLATVDVLALLTLAHLHQLHIAVDRFEKLHIPQASIDILIEEIHQLGQLDREHGWIGIEGDRFVFDTIPKEVTERNIRFLESILSFARESCQVVPIMGAVELGRDTFEQSESVIGRGSIASILAAKETNSLLYSDDYVARTVAQRMFSVDSAWTQPVLLSAHERGLLTASEYHDSIAALVLANYSYVPLNDSILMRILEKNEWVVTPEVTKVFGPLGSSETQWHGVIRILSDLVARIWSKPHLIPLFNRYQIVDLCLRTMARNRGGTVVLQIYEPMIQEKFPPQAAHAVSQWFEVHRRLQDQNALA